MSQNDEALPFGFLGYWEQHAVFCKLCRKAGFEYDSQTDNVVFQVFRNFCHELNAEVIDKELVNKDLEWGILGSIKDWKNNQLSCH